MYLTLKVLSFNGKPIGKVVSVSFDRKDGTIGRSLSNDLVLPDPDNLVSREHARILYEKGFYYLQDISLNGIIIRNKSIKLYSDKIKLEQGDIIEICGYVLLVILHSKIKYESIVDSFVSNDLDPIPPRSSQRLIQKQRPPRAKIEYGIVCPSPTSQERIEFGVFCPEQIVPNSIFLIDVWAYLPKDYSEIIKIAKTLDRENLLNRKTGITVEIGSSITLSLKVDGLDVQDPMDTIIWEGVPTNSSFIVKVPDKAKVGSYPGKVLVRHGGCVIAKIMFIVEISSENNYDYTDVCKQSIYPKTAFASYSSANREQVLSRIQGMKKIAPELDIFIDMVSLRSGQNWQEMLDTHVPTKDIFYLFWSKDAARSEWVEKEWKLAIKRRGVEYIDPVPLVDPEIAPAPKELASLHFNDAWIAYISYENLKRYKTAP